MSIEIVQNLAYIATFLFVIYFVLTLCGIELDFGVEAGVLSFFSLQGILIGVMTFSWGYLFFSQYFESSSVITWFAIGLGLTFMVLFKFLFKLLKKTSSEFGIARFEPKAGLNGVVYLTVPEKEKFGGQVTFECRSIGTLQLNVLNRSGFPIPTGEKVVVEESVLNDDDETYTIYVKPLSKKGSYKKEENSNKIDF